MVFVVLVPRVVTDSQQLNTAYCLEILSKDSLSIMTCVAVYSLSDVLWGSKGYVRRLGLLLFLE